MDKIKSETGSETEIRTDFGTENGTESEQNGSCQGYTEHDGTETEVTEVKRKRNYPANRKSSPRPTRSIQASDDLVRKVGRHNMELFMMDTIDLMKGEEVAKRSAEYFEICERNDMRPTVAGYALALGVDRHTLGKIRTGEDIYSRTQYMYSRSVIKRVLSLLNSSIEDYLQNDTKSTIASLFLLKNHFGYQDRNETIVTHESGQEQKSVEDIRRRYIVDAEEKPARNR